MIFYGRGALYLVWVNFVRIQRRLRVTPAMAAGVTERLWEMANIVAFVDTNQPSSEEARTLHEKKFKLMQCQGWLFSIFPC